MLGTTALVRDCAVALAVGAAVRVRPRGSCSGVCVVGPQPTGLGPKVGAKTPEPLEFKRVLNLLPGSTSIPPFFPPPTPEAELPTSAEAFSRPRRRRTPTLVPHTYRNPTPVPPLPQPHGAATPACPERVHDRTHAQRLMMHMWHVHCPTNNWETVLLARRLQSHESENCTEQCKQGKACSSLPQLQAEHHGLLPHGWFCTVVRPSHDADHPPASRQHITSHHCAQP